MNHEKPLPIHIRESVDSDTDAINALLLEAFGTDGEGPEIVGLVNELASDPSAQPLLSLVARHGDVTLGHILFSHARVLRSGMDPLSASILAPLAVHPAMQSRGVGTRLIQAGLARLAARGTNLVFVLGHPGYYNRHGFAPALATGLDAPHPIPAEHHDAWMVQVLSRHRITSLHGRVSCADALDDQHYWVA